MEFRHILSLSSALCCLAVLGSHVQASQPAEDYWQTLWPNTPMPNALRGLVQPVINEPARCKDTVPNGIFIVEQDLNRKLTKSSDEFTLPATLEAVILNYIDYGGQMNSEVERLQKKVPNGTFFFENDIVPDKKLHLALLNPNSATFLPDKVAKTIPFSSNRVPEILNRLSIEAKSTMCERVKHGIEMCERPTMMGEEKHCATSLESLVNFVVSKLGKNIKLLSIEFEKGTKDRQYMVERVEKNAEKTVVCHKMDYPHALFYCHKVPTRSYTISLVAIGDGTKVKAIAACHPKTAHWNPQHIAFKQLNVKPGTVPICHFLTTNTLLWVPNLALKEGEGVAA